MEYFILCNVKAPHREQEGREKERKIIGHARAKGDRQVMCVRVWERNREVR